MIIENAKNIKKWLLRTNFGQRVAFVGVFAVIGTLFILATHAATVSSSIAVSTSLGSLAGSASVVPDSGAIGGQAVKFGTSSTSSGSSSTLGSGQDMVVGVNINGIGSNPGPDIAGAVKYVRADLKSWGISASEFTGSGIKVDDLLQGPYSTSGISGLGSAATWAANALSWYQADGCTPALCPMIEVLNEPGGTWFWGNNALSSANATAYDNVLIATYNAFSNAYGSSRPVVLASVDGGYATGSNWGQLMWQANSQIGNYIDGITVHPYNQQTTDLGPSETSVSTAYNQIKSLAGHNIPLYITEIGWQTTPTASETAAGDTPLSQVTMSTALQCSNMYNFVSWARGTNYINAVMNFDYRDDSQGDGTFGIEYGDGSHKPSYAALAAASANQANPC